MVVCPSFELGLTTIKCRVGNSSPTWKPDIPDVGKSEEVGQGGGSDQVCHQEEERKKKGRKEKDEKC